MPLPDANLTLRDGEPGILRPERLRIARQLHDTLCQELTGICFMANAAAFELAEESPRAQQKLRELADYIQRTGAGLAQLVNELSRE